jgi:transcriptional regulator with XRE-family HTH domain
MQTKEGVQPPSYPKKPVSINHQVGRRIKTLREERGLTQLIFAMEIGVDRSYLSDLENGKKSMTVNVLHSVAIAFKLSLSDLLKDL